jgi:MFS transporter, DHA1 family, multidrug resistance protein
MIVNRYDQKKLLNIAYWIFIFSLISVAAVAFFNNTNALWITLAFIPFVIGQIIPSTILYPLCLNFMPEAKGRVSALIQGARLIFSALFLQIAGYFYQGTFLNIGIIISCFIFVGIITLFNIIKNEKLMKLS